MPKNSSLNDTDHDLLVKIAGNSFESAGGTTVTAGLSDAQLRASPVPVTGSFSVTGALTNAELRAAAVPVSGPVTDTQLRATAVPVSGPLTDTQLRATPLPVAGNPAQVSSVPSNFTIITSAANITLAAGDVLNIQALGTAPLFVKRGSGASATSFNYILPGATASDDGTGGFLIISDFIGAVSFFATSVRYMAWKR